MSSSRIRRIAKEIADIEADTQSKIMVEPAGASDDLTHLRGQFLGPADTPYEGGRYLVDIRIPPEYPFRPPIMKFDTRIWHPNVSSQTGAICLDTLSTAWSPVLTIKSALISLQSLLSTPEPKDPQDAEVAGMLLRNKDEFEHVARDWAVRHAGAPRRDRGEASTASTPTAARRKSQQAKEREEKSKVSAYHGYNKALVDRFANMGFDVTAVVAAFEHVGIDRRNGDDYQLEEAYMGDVTARLFNEA